MPLVIIIVLMLVGLGFFVVLFALSMAICKGLVSLGRFIKYKLSRHT